MSDVLGYARVSTADQELEVQRHRLRNEGAAVRIFEDVASGRNFVRPGLGELLQYSRPGDVICVVRFGLSP